MDILINLIIASIFGTITAAIAYSRGRNAIGWFFVGFFTGCIGLIIVLCLPNLKEEEARWQRSNIAQRRMREQLKQERLKQDGFRQHVHKRLDLHDKALGMNSRQIAASAVPPPLPIDAPSIGEERAEWYYADGENQIGPVSIVILEQMINESRINEHTLVWNESLDNWKPLGQVTALRERLL